MRKLPNEAYSMELEKDHHHQHPDKLQLIAPLQK